MPTTEKQREAMRRYYQKRKLQKKAVLLQFDRKEDADVLAKLDTVNRTPYVAGLIRKDING